MTCVNTLRGTHPTVSDGPVSEDLHSGSPVVALKHDIKAAGPDQNIAVIMTTPKDRGLTGWRSELTRSGRLAYKAFVVDLQASLLIDAVMGPSQPLTDLRSRWFVWFL